MIEGAPLGLVAEVWGDCYRAKPYLTDALVVDVGAGVGVFTLFALEHGARMVLAIEPHYPSKEMLEFNTQGLPVLIMDTPVGDGSKVAWREEGHGIQTFPGEWRDTMTLAQLPPHIDVLKVDCEGAEYPFLIGADLDGVGYLAVELHVWSAEPNDEGLGVRPDPPPRPIELIEWIVQTHHLSYSSDQVVSRGGLLYGALEQL